MNSRKRQASESLLPFHNPKQPRLVLRAPDGGAPSPSAQTPDIVTRWRQFGHEFKMLAADTASYLLSKLTIHDNPDTVAEEVPSTLTPSQTPSPTLDKSPHGDNQASSQSTDSSSSINTEEQHPSIFTSLANAIFGTSSQSPPSPSNNAATSQKASSSSEKDLSVTVEPLPESKTNLPSSIPTPPPDPLPVTPTPRITKSHTLSTLYESRPQTMELGSSRLLFTSSSTADISSFRPFAFGVTPVDHNRRSNQVSPLLYSTASRPQSSSSALFNHSTANFTPRHSRNTSRKSSLSSIHKDPHTRNPDKRRHILHDVHKANVHHSRKLLREEISRQIFAIRRQNGYTSGYSDFKGLLDYQRKLDDIQLDNPRRLTPAVLGDIRSKPLVSKPSIDEDDRATVFLQRVLDNAKATLNSPKPPKPFIPTFEQLKISQRAKDDEIERRLRPPVVPLPSSLPPQDDAQVRKLFEKRGLVAKFEREQVCDNDIQRLRPAQWLNDEVINFYGAMILARSDAATRAKSGNGPKVTADAVNAHYFNTFFWTKLTVDGYEKGRLAKWTKKIDIFSKDVILIPVNHGNAHWTAAAINFRRKRVESYDSMGMARQVVFRHLRAYLEAEHLNKKKMPFDFAGWEDWAPDETPRQENGFDCGVFTCQFLETLARGEEHFNFSQKDMPYLRRRMVWEIGNTKLRDEH